MSTPTYNLHHTFPRPRKGRDIAQASALILQSIVNSGLLLVPEVVQLPRMLDEPVGSNPRILKQLRTSFTLIREDELPAHTKLFGPVSVEFYLDDLRPAGILPVFYFPSPTVNATGASDLGFRIIRDFHDIYKILELNPNPIGWPKDRVKDLMLTIQSLAALFYPADSLQEKDENGLWKDIYKNDLQFFSQREWRLIGGVVADDAACTQPLSEKEIERLKQIDRDFFCNPQRGFNGNPKSSFCTMMRTIKGVPIRKWIKRVHIHADVAKTCLPVLREEGLENLGHVWG